MFEMRHGVPNSEVTKMMDDYIDQQLHARMNRLEREAQDLMNQGYSLDQLTIIVQGDGEGHVRPKSELD